MFCQRATERDAERALTARLMKQSRTYQKLIFFNICCCYSLRFLLGNMVSNTSVTALPQHSRFEICIITFYLYMNVYT